MLERGSLVTADPQQMTLSFNYTRLRPRKHIRTIMHRHAITLQLKFYYKFTISYIDNVLQVV